jgi:hypothetical protein
LFRQSGIDAHPQFVRLQRELAIANRTIDRLNQVNAALQRQLVAMRSNIAVVAYDLMIERLERKEVR